MPRKRGRGRGRRRGVYNRNRSPTDQNDTSNVFNPSLHENTSVLDGNLDTNSNNVCAERLQSRQEILGHSQLNLLSNLDTQVSNSSAIDNQNIAPPSLSYFANTNENVASTSRVNSTSTNPPVRIIPFGNGFAVLPTNSNSVLKINVEDVSSLVSKRKDTCDNLIASNCVNSDIVASKNTAGLSNSNVLTNSSNLVSTSDNKTSVCSSIDTHKINNLTTVGSSFNIVNSTNTNALLSTHHNINKFCCEMLEKQQMLLNEISGINRQSSQLVASHADVVASTSADADQIKNLDTRSSVAGSCDLSSSNVKSSYDTEEEEIVVIADGDIASTDSFKDHSYSKSLPSGKLNDSAIEDECPVCLQTFVHPSRLPCSHVFCFLCVKGIAMSGQSCPMCRAPVPHFYSDNPVLVSLPSKSKQIDDKEKKEEKYSWFYQGRSGGWWEFEERMSNEIEENHNAGRTVFDMMICGQLYTIDTTANVQYPKNCPFRIRRILRDLPSRVLKKGVAGIHGLNLPSTSKQ